jgi:uncharacterized protein (DUF302 family)
MAMPINALSEIATIERCAIDTGLPYEAAAAAFERSLGRLETETSEALVSRTAPWPEVEAEMARMAGDAGLMILAHFDQGAIASLSGAPVRCRLYIVGNPAVAAKILRIDIRASLYVPFRVALFERRDNGLAVLSFDRPSSLLGALTHPELDAIGIMLDAKIDAVIQKVRTAGAAPAQGKLDKRLETRGGFQGRSS